MKIKVLTLFPEMYAGFLTASMVGKAIEIGAVEVEIIDIRDFATGKHKQADDYPYGGNAGMVMKPEPIYSAINYALNNTLQPVIYFTPHGRTLTQSILDEYHEVDNLVLLCGHYKEIDQRIRNVAVTDEISIGDYVLSGGELAAMVFIDGLTRLQPGVLNNMESADTDSFQDGGLGHPQWTRPDTFLGMKVPDVLCSGNHKLIKQFQEQEAEKMTRIRRPDLISK